MTMSIAFLNWSRIRPKFRSGFFFPDVLSTGIFATLVQIRCVGFLVAGAAISRKIENVIELRKENIFHEKREAAATLRGNTDSFDDGLVFVAQGPSAVC